MSQVIRGGPFQIIDRRDQLWLQLAAFFYICGIA
jgi:hypothetical protein